MGKGAEICEGGKRTRAIIREEKAVKGTREHQQETKEMGNGRGRRRKWERRTGRITAKDRTSTSP